MKQVGSVVLAAVLALAFTACSSDRGQEAGDTWVSQLGNQGVIRIGISPNYPPYEDVDTEGNLVGYDVDFAAFVSQHIDCDMELVSLEFNAIPASLDAGTIDLGVSCFSYKEDRIVEYSDSYLDMTQSILVRADSGILASEDLAGRAISAGRGNAGLDLCYELQADLDDVKVIVGQETAGSVDALTRGEFDAYIAERAVCEVYAGVSDGQLIVLDEDFRPDSIYVIARQGHKLLIDRINEAIAAYRESAISREVFDKWFL